MRKVKVLGSDSLYKFIFFSSVWYIKGLLTVQLLCHIFGWLYNHANQKVSPAHEVFMHSLFKTNPSSQTFFFVSCLLGFYSVQVTAASFSSIKRNLKNWDTVSSPPGWTNSHVEKVGKLQHFRNESSPHLRPQWCQTGQNVRVKEAFFLRYENVST